MIDLSGIEVRDTDDKGRCVYTKKAIKKGDTYIAQGVFLSEFNIYRDSELKMYTFNTQWAHTLLLILEWPSFMSNSTTPNMRCIGMGKKMAMTVEALRDIQPGEELTIYYGYDVFEHGKQLGIDINEWNNKTIK